eukprot:1637001-Prymnesium_polylepis.1
MLHDEERAVEEVEPDVVGGHGDAEHEERNHDARVEPPLDEAVPDHLRLHVRFDDVVDGPKGRT